MYYKIKNFVKLGGGFGDLVHGELITFANPGLDRLPIDRLEAFDPNGRCVYTRGSGGGVEWRPEKLLNIHY